ncbi:MAG TPA: STAS domain-containing protein [Chthoniobacterales bacterium]
MEIHRAHENDSLVLTLNGRLDAAWAEPVQAALESAIRGGEHSIVMDFAGVDYISSAGLRVVISGYKQLLAIKGAFSLRNAQPGVAKVIELSGLGVLLAAPAPVVGAAREVRSFESASAKWQSHGSAVPVRLRAIGEGAFDVSGGEKIDFVRPRFGLGVGALAETREKAMANLGEMLCMAGCVAHLPTNGALRPDFLLAEQAYVPSGWLASGLVAEGDPGLLLRFEVRPECRGVPLAEVCAAMLENSGAPAAAFVLAAEVAGLVGAALRQPPSGLVRDPFGFPEIRDRLNFTSERSFRDSVCLAAGVVARPGTEWDAHLRSVDSDGTVKAHVHAAVFPYRPIRKGSIVLDETVREIFEAGGLQAVLHLLNDTRDPEGSGDSEFLRGACWVAPVSGTP